MRYRCPFCPDVACRLEMVVMVHMYRAHRSLPDFANVPIPFDTFAIKAEKKDGLQTMLKKEYSFGSDGKVFFKDNDG